MQRILKSIAATEAKENTANDTAEKPDQHLDNTLQEDSGTHLTDEEKEQKLAQYKLWLSWIQQRQEALDQLDLKLRRMWKIARQAMEPGVSKSTQRTLNKELTRLEAEVHHLDKVSREKEMMLEHMKAMLTETSETP